MLPRVAAAARVTMRGLGVGGEPVMIGDKQGIHGLVKHLEDCWNRGDSKTYVEPFAEDVTFIQIFGGQLDGRDAVEASHRSIFDTIYRGSRVGLSIRSIRFLGTEVAIVF